MTARRVAGWALPSLIPGSFVAVAIVSGQLTEFVIGLGIAALLCLVTFAGLHLIHDK